MNKDSELGRKLTRRYTAPLPSSIKSRFTTKSPITVKTTKSPSLSHRKIFKADYFDELTKDIASNMKTVIEKAILPAAQLSQDIEKTMKTERDAIDALINHQWGFSESIPFQTFQEINTVNQNSGLSSEQKRLQIDEELSQAFRFFEEQGIGSHPFLFYARECMRKHLGYGWDLIAEELYDHVTYHRKYSAIPLMFIMMERLMVNLHETHLDKSQNSIIKSFQKKIKSKHQDIRYVMNYEGYARMFNSIIEPKIFGRAEHDDPPEGILNRHLVVHGKSNPSIWTNVDMYKLLTVLFGMAETIEAYRLIELEMESESENE